MTLKVKFCVDAQNTVGIFNVEIKSGMAHMVVHETGPKGEYFLSLENDDGELFVRISNPDLTEKGLPPKSKMKVQINDVYQVVSSTLMVLSYSGSTESPVSKAESSSESGEVHDEVDENTLTRNMKHLKDPAQLPSVEGAKLNYDFQFTKSESEPKKASEKAKQFRINTDSVTAKTESARLREGLEPRPPAELMTEDIRDRRVFLKGKKYSLKNKLSAVIALCSIFSISIYTAFVAWDIGHREVVQWERTQSEFLYANGQHLADRFNVQVGHVDMLASFLGSATINDIAELQQTISHNKYLAALGYYEIEFVPQGSDPESLRAPSSEGLPRLPMAEGIFAVRKISYNLVERAADLKMTEEELEGKWLKKILEFYYKSQNADGSTTAYLRPEIFSDGSLEILRRVRKGSKISFLISQISGQFAVDSILRSENFGSAVVTSLGDLIGNDDIHLPDEVKGSVISALLKSPGSTSTGVYDVEGGRRHYQAYNIGRGLAAYSEFDESLASSHQFWMYWRTIIVGILLVTGTIFLGISFSRSLSRPLAQLAESTERLAAGDYVTLPHITSNDEIGTLADYFTHLSESLHRKEKEIARVTELAARDALTGLYNSRHFRWEVHRNIERARKEKYQFSLILLDVDDFKVFNAQFGHIQGDVVLKDIADILKYTSRPDSIISRIGPEEFAVLLPNCPLMAAQQVTDKILGEIRLHKILNLTGGRDLGITCSAGVTEFSPTEHKTPEGLLKVAESHLVMSKRNGKNRAWAS